MFEDDEDDLFEEDVFCRNYKPKKRRVKNPCSEIMLKPEETKMLDKKLYEIKTEGNTRYGHKLAVNSQGYWVMEIKGTGEVLAVDKSFVQEVLPYSIGVQFESGKTVYHYLGEAGKHQVGDMFVLDAPNGRAIVQVVAVDTKNTNATKHFNPIAKLATIEI